MTLIQRRNNVVCSVGRSVFDLLLFLNLTISNKSEHLRPGDVVSPETCKPQP